MSVGVPGHASTGARNQLQDVMEAPPPAWYSAPADSEMSGHTQCQKRPSLVSKETYTCVKRDPHLGIHSVNVSSEAKQTQYRGKRDLGIHRVSSEAEGAWNVVTLYMDVECRDVVHGPVTKNDSGKSEPYIHVQ